VDCSLSCGGGELEVSECEQPASGMQMKQDDAVCRCPVPEALPPRIAAKQQAQQVAPAEQIQELKEEGLALDAHEWPALSRVKDLPQRRRATPWRGRC